MSLHDHKGTVVKELIISTRTFKNRSVNGNICRSQPFKQLKPNQDISLAKGIRATSAILKPIPSTDQFQRLKK
jgi:hypothetical protein